MPRLCSPLCGLLRERRASGPNSRRTKTKMNTSSCLPSGPIKRINLHRYYMPPRGRQFWVAGMAQRYPLRDMIHAPFPCFFFNIASLGKRGHRPNGHAAIGHTDKEGAGRAERRLEKARAQGTNLKRTAYRGCFVSRLSHSVLSQRFADNIWRCSPGFDQGFYFQMNGLGAWF